MACTTTRLYKENIYNPDVEQTISVVINNKVVDPSFVKTIKYDDKVFEVESVSIGNAVAREIQLELSNEFTEEFTEVLLSSTLHIETPENITLGTYIVAEKDNSNDSYTKYVLHDYMDKFHKKYDGSLVVPCTRFNLLKSICNFCGIELENSSIINGDIMVNVYDNTLEAWDYVRYIAERAASNAKITRFNKLKIKELNTNESTTLPEDMVGDYSYDDQKTITKVAYENATQKFEKGNNVGECINLSQYSPFSCSQEEIDNIFQSLNGLTYQSFKVRIWGDPSVDAGDKLIFGNIKSFAQMSWEWGNGFYGEYDCQLKTNQETSLVERLTNSQKIRRIKSLLDEANMQIDLLLEENEENKTSITNLNLSLEGIKSSVTKKIEDLENNTTPIALKKGVKSAVIYNAAEKTFLWQKTYGESIQSIRSGKNLIHLNETATGFGVTATNNNDGTITLNGTATNNMDLWIANGKGIYATDYSYKFSKGTKFTQRRNIISGTYTGVWELKTITYDSDTSTVQWGKIINDITTTITFNGETRGIELYIPKGTVFENLVIFPQLEIGSTATEPEQYGASPSLNYPSEIKNVSGEISVNITGENIWNNSLVNENNVTKNDDGFTITDKWATEVFSNENVLKTFKPNTKYTIKTISKILAKPTTLGTSGTSGYDLVLYRANNPVWLLLNSYEKYNANIGDVITSYKTITTPEDLAELRVLGYSFYGNNDGSTTYRGIGSVEIQQIMVVEGEYTKTNFPEYEPYKSNTLTIDLQGNELCSLPNKNNDEVTNGTKDELVIESSKAKINKNIRHLSLAFAEMNNNDTYPGWKNQTQLKNDWPGLNTSFNLANINIRSNITNNASAIKLNTNAAGIIFFQSSFFEGLTQAEIKAKYPDLVLDLYYEMPETEEIDLGAIDLINTFKGTNHINFTELSDFYYYRDNALNEIYVLKGENEEQLRNINETFAEQEITNNSIIQRVQEANETMSKDYALKEEVSSEIQQAAKTLSIEFNEQIENLQNKKVDTLENKLVTININGIQVSTNVSTVKTIMNNDRFSIKSGDAEAFFVGYDEELKQSVSRMNNLAVTDYFTAGYHRQEKFNVDVKKRTGWFYVGGE